MVRMLARVNYFARYIAIVTLESELASELLNSNRALNRAYNPYHCRGDEGRQQQEMVGELASILISVVNVNTHPVHDMTSDQQSKTICAAVYPVSSFHCLL